MKLFSSIFVAIFTISASWVALAHGSASTLAPQVLIVTPAGSQTVMAGDVTVDLMATGLEIKKADGEHADGIGHFHLYLGEHAMEAKAGEPIGKDWIHTAELKYTFKDVKPGHYVLTVVLADGKHVPIESATAKATVSFSVEAATAATSSEMAPKTEEHSMDHNSMKKEEMSKKMEQHHGFMLWIAGLLAVAVAALYIFVFSK
jgi:hypothetical protein